MATTRRLQDLPLASLRAALAGEPLLGFDTKDWAGGGTAQAKPAFVGMVNSITVTNNNDSGAGSLRQAIADADGTVGDDFINFDPSLAGQTILLGTPLTITSGVSINGDVDGNTTPDVTISGGGSTNVFTVDTGSGGPEVALLNLNINRGSAFGTPGAFGSGGGMPGSAGGDAGGGVYLKSGTLNLANDTFTDNAAQGGAGGYGGYDGSPFAPTNKGAGGAGGNAAGAVFVAPGATISASNLTFAGTQTGTGGMGGAGNPPGATGTGSPISNSAIVRAAAVCFTTGTLIRTTRGDVAVEDLRIGDLAVTGSGLLRPITWIGHRDLAGSGAALPHDQQPIRVRRGAFGSGLPRRDLCLSPGHPVLVGADADGEDGALVPIMCLINGTTIARQDRESVTYWHVELDAHDILLAEGLPAESYLDWGDRVFFTESAEHALHNPDFVAPGLSGRCRPVAVEGALVEAERGRLDAVFCAELTAQSGWSEASSDSWLAA